MIEIYIYDVFTKTKGKGNPAGVVFENNNYSLTDNNRLEIAKYIRCNETLFISFSKIANYKFRYFTPGHEIPLCGHATLAGIQYLLDNGHISEKLITIETQNAKINIEHIHDKEEIEMQQDRSQFMAFEGDYCNLCKSIGITEDDLHESLEVIYGSTGTWTLLVPVKSEKILRKMKPQNKVFSDVLSALPKASIHPYSVNLKKNPILVSARHFSSPYSGTVEDPVTGTASGVISEYLFKTVFNHKNSIQLHIKQGCDVGREGELTVISEKGKNVKIRGKCIYNQTLEYQLSTVSN